MSIVVGIDEVGRGPIAGPVTVCGCLMKESNMKCIVDMKDSKMYSSNSRKNAFNKLKSFESKNLLKYFIVSKSANYIDKYGIQQSIKSCIEIICKQLIDNIKSTKILLDGGLYAPNKYKQETFIKGDQRFSIISSASIIAKVTRDKYMTRKSKEYPCYLFAQNKGYGTKKHFDSIKKYGLSTLHRKTYIHL